MTQLLANERPIISTRQHWSMVVPSILMAAIAALVVVGVFHFLPDSIAGHSTSSLVNWVRAAVLVIAFIIAATLFLQWRAAVYTLTDRRIVVSRGVVSKVTESITLDRIQDVIVRQGLLERMLGAGSVDIESAGRDGVEVLRRIARPQAFYNALMESMEAHRTGQLGGAPAVAAPANPGPAGGV